MNEYEVLFNKARAFHGHVCPGIVLGTRLTMAGMRELGIDPQKPQHNLIVYVEIDRCGADAVQAITGCSFGHRTLKYKDFGKFAATFVDIAARKAVRVSVHEKDRAAHDLLERDELLRLLGAIPESEILKIEHVTVEIPDDDLPGFPHKKEICSGCGEQIVDNRHITADGTILCRNCGGSSYYTVIAP